ncbi:MAG: hypothetical protein ACP5M4_04755 [Acidobacteriaceae bacterium]
MGEIRRFVIVWVAFVVGLGCLPVVGYGQAVREWSGSAWTRVNGAAGLRGESDALAAMYGWVSSVPSPAVDVIPAAKQVTEQQSFVVTVQVGGELGAPAPTGTVELFAGSLRLSGVLDAGGAAAFTVPGGVLAAGTDLLTASYTPDAASASYYSAATGEAQVVVNAEPAYFSIVAPAMTIERGAITGNTVAVTVYPYRGFTGVVNLTAAVTGTPRVVHDLPRLSFGSTNPVNIVGGAAGTAILTVTTTGSGGVIAGGAAGTAAETGGGVMLAALLWMTWPVRKKRWMQRRWVRTLHSIEVGVFSLWLMGCGVTGQPEASVGTTPGTYTVTVTGAAAGVSSTGAFTITVR